MPEQQSARIFISYSRKDGATFAAELRERLLRENLSVWQDIVMLEGGHDWWSQIDDVLKSRALEHFVLVVTPAALASQVIRREIRLARQEGKTVCPIRGPGIGDLSELPRWLGQLYDLKLPEHRTTLIRVLQAPSRRSRVAMMAPEPPPDYVHRSLEFDTIKKQLLDSKGDSIAITAALRGAGGYGKTTLAKALAHDPDIQEAYFDGILWVELGETPDNLLSILSDLIETLSGSRPGFETINAAAAKLGEALGDRRILLIVDDAWRGQDLRPFLQGGTRTTRLITTRRDDILPADSARQPVDAMRESEALALLSSGLPEEEVTLQHVQLRYLAARLGEWALLLKLVNGFLHDRVAKKQALGPAIAAVNQRLDEKGLVAFDARNEVDRNKAVARTIDVSLDILDKASRFRFRELAIFPEDVDIPIAIIARLWAETGGLHASDTEDLLTELCSLSLLLELDLDQHTVRLHDSIRHFLCDQAGNDQLIACHKCLLRVLDAISESSNPDVLTQRYYHLWLLHHLAMTGDRERLDAFLLNPSWLIAKLAATRSPQTLIGDYERYGVGVAQDLICRTLRLTAGICGRDPRQLIPQLLGRLMRCKASGISAFLDAARRRLVAPSLITQHPSLTSPGAENARLEGHSGPVLALCLLDGQLVSGSYDNTIRTWDVKAGAETACLEGHLAPIVALCSLPDGRLAAGSADNTIRLWDVKTGAVTVCLEGHSDPVTALCLLPDGDGLASGSVDHTIRLWDVKTGAVTAYLVGHSGPINALCLLPDGRLASCSGDKTIRLWDVMSGTESACLEGHLDSVYALCLLPDGRLASGSWDSTVRLWDVKSGALSACLDCQEGWVLTLCLLPNGQLAIGTRDATIRIWDVTTGAESARLEGHSGGVVALCLLPDGRLASSSRDSTIRLWDVKGAVEVGSPIRRSGPIFGLCLLPEGGLASCSWDGSIALWDVKSGSETARLGGHSDPVYKLCSLPDGGLASASRDAINIWDVTTSVETTRLQGHVGSVDALCVLPSGLLVSGGEDRTIRIWDVKTGAEITCLKRHSGPVLSLCLLPDGRLASGSRDNTIRLWNIKAGAQTAYLEGHSGGVVALCVLPDGRLASSSRDNTIRLWDVRSGTETACLKDHSGGVEALSLLPDGRLASGSMDNTIRLWDAGTLHEIARLEIDAPVRCLATLANHYFVAGDQLGRLHWLEIVD